MKLSALALVTLAVLVLPTAASARPASTTFTATGYEYAFTQTVGSFAGSATGNAGDTGLWNTTVQHDPLGSMPTYINGGTFAMTTVGSGGHVDFVDGDFVHHGGTITTLDRGANCTNQRFQVTGRLHNVSTRTTSGGTGTFSVVLTHYRRSILGHCIIYKARVVGGVGFSY
ncbi:MAG TPA: hypothetical protein VKB73_06310 [Gaiellaceae bacterium]|nr:hypothetical protein [Gaiellaceae bacterium]